MRRREFIAFLGSAVAACPFAARAQQALPVVGFANSGSAQTQALMAAAYRKGLEEAGFVEGKNVRIEFVGPTVSTTGCRNSSPISSGAGSSSSWPAVRLLHWLPRQLLQRSPSYLRPAIIRSRQV